MVILRMMQALFAILNRYSQLVKNDALCGVPAWSANCTAAPPTRSTPRQLTFEAFAYF